jgi:hypothetical protein
LLLSNNRLNVPKIAEKVVNLLERNPIFEVEGDGTTVVDGSEFLVKTEGRFAFLRLV